MDSLRPGFQRDFHIHEQQDSKTTISSQMKDSSLDNMKSSRQNDAAGANFKYEQSTSDSVDYETSFQGGTKAKDSRTSFDTNQERRKSKHGSSGRATFSTFRGRQREAKETVNTAGDENVNINQQLKEQQAQNNPKSAQTENFSKTNEKSFDSADMAVQGLQDSANQDTKIGGTTAFNQLNKGSPWGRASDIPKASETKNTDTSFFQKIKAAVNNVIGRKKE